jgi:xanthine dehydrogenase YagS FAD-binding subunit
MNDFRYGKPASLDQAVAYLAKGGSDVFLMGGGTDLLGEIKDGIIRPDVVIDLKAVPGLAYIKKDRDAVAIGALTTLAEIASDPTIAREYRVLHEAANAAASPQLRNMGTVGGNLCQRPRCWYFRNAETVCNKKGGTQCFAEKGRNKYHAILAGGLCYAVNPSDLAPALIALDAKAVIVSAKGDRTVPLAEFYTPPIVNVRKENVLGAGDILREVRIPLAKLGDKSTYVKFTERGGWDFAVASAAVKASMSGSSMTSVRIVCGGVATVPWRLKAAEDALRGSRPTESAAKQAAAKALTGAQPLAENGYKVDILKAVVAQAVANLGK